MLLGRQHLYAYRIPGQQPRNIIRLSAIARHFFTATMAPTSGAYDFIVIGGGSGGSGAARRASGWYKAKTLIIENNRSGGTCVNVGCVPKKISYLCATVSEVLKDASTYGFKLPNDISLNYSDFKKKRDAVIERLNGIYETNWSKEGIDLVRGSATFKGPKEIEVTLSDGGGKVVYTAPHILVASGGHPTTPPVPGGHHCLTSDGFFDIEHLPKKMAVIGAGYIAVEFTGVLNALGVEMHMFIRGDTFLRSFDPMVQDTITKQYESDWVIIHKNSKTFQKIERLDDPKREGVSPANFEKYGEGPSPHKRLRITTGDGEVIEFDEVLWAIGRKPEIEDLNPSKVGVGLRESGHIVVDEYQNTSVEGIYALGDVTGQVELTPMAIAAGRQLSNRLFGPPHLKSSKVDYTNVPTVVFSHPEVGTIGLTEPVAVEKYGREALKVYQTKFAPMFYDIFPKEERSKHPVQYKVICAGPDEKVVGLHIIGPASSEILQGFGVAIKMGATKKDLDSCIAIHPTSAEELVTLK